MTREEALRAATMAGAYAMFAEDILGSIEVGKAGDLVVLDRNLFETPPQEISESLVLMTVLDGTVIHRSEP